VANPSTPDNAIAKKIGISRQAFSNIRQRFENDGLIRILNIPNIQLLGSEIVVFSHILFNPDALIEERRKGIKLVVEESPAVFIISGSFESVMLHYAQDYNDFNFLKNKFLSYYSTHNFLRSVGNITLLPVKSLKNHKSFDFSGALKELLV
jgi:DNA-binding Lrp family transcriptional regulator